MATQPPRAVPRPALHPCSCGGWSTLDVGQQRIWDYALKPKAIPSLNPSGKSEFGAVVFSVVTQVKRTASGQASLLYRQISFSFNVRDTK